MASRKALDALPNSRSADKNAAGSGGLCSGTLEGIDNGEGNMFASAANARSENLGAIGSAG